MKPDAETSLNTEPRVPCCLLLDTSGSMKGPKIQALNAGLQVFYTDLNLDPLAQLQVEVNLISFNSRVTTVQDWVAVHRWTDIPQLAADGATHLGEAILQGIDAIERRVRSHQAHQLAGYVPWCFLITDGQPEGEPPDVIERAAQRIKEMEAARQLAFFAVGVEGANMDKLAKLSVRRPLPLRGLAFNELFTWLSMSLTAVSRSRVGEEVPLSPPDGWARV